MTRDSYRQPCPGRIFEDLGVGFSIGCFGGSIFYFLKGKVLDVVCGHRGSVIPYYVHQVLSAILSDQVDLIVVLGVGWPPDGLYLDDLSKLSEGKGYLHSCDLSEVLRA